MTRLRWQSSLIRWQHLGFKRNRPECESQRGMSKFNTSEYVGLPDRRRLGFVRSVLLVLVLIMFFTALTAILIEWRMSPVIKVWAETRAINLATRAINIAVEETMAASISATEIAHIITDNQGNLQAIQYDTGEINRVSSQATHKIQQSLNNLGEENFPIPLGQITGLDFIAAWGPGIPIRIIPVGSVQTSPMSSFEDAGINQTWHRVFLDVNVIMRVAIPLIAHEFVVRTRIPIVEEVIIGSVPTWYFAPNGTVGGFSPEQFSPYPGLVEFNIEP